jgi:hypothetical protein
MRIRPLWFYEARIAFGWTALLPALLLPAYAALVCFTRRNDVQPPDAGTIAFTFERLVPLCAGLLASHLMSLEREERFDEMRRAYPEPSWCIPVLRTFGALLLTVSAAALAALIFQLVYGGYAWGEIGRAVFSPTLYLLGLALLVNNISGNYWIAATGVVAYWFFEYSTNGRHSGLLFLFRATTMVENVDYDINRVLLGGLGLVWMTANVLYSQWRRVNSG